MKNSSEAQLDFLCVFLCVVLLIVFIVISGAR